MSSSDREKDKTETSKSKKHGILCTLRKLTPPKKQPSNPWPKRPSNETAELLEQPDAYFDPDLVLYYCPALTCYKRLVFDEVVAHVKAEHAMVVSEVPEHHSNSVEVEEKDMEPGSGSAAWAPTLLDAFDCQFFFETCRHPNGNWFMWVYCLCAVGESSNYLADIKISHGNYSLTYSGPVFSLETSQTTVTNSGKCLEFRDDFAKVLMKKLKRTKELTEEMEDEERKNVLGICYDVRISKASNKH